MRLRYAWLLLPWLFTGCIPEGSDTPATQPSTLDTSLACDSYQPGSSVSGDYLCAHNAVRASAQPAPVPPLADFSWDTDLATVAQAWVETCTWSHNPERSSAYLNLSGDEVYVGENLYMSSATAVSPYDAVTSWASEAQHYDYASNSCADGEVCGHYTQLVWRDSLKVGCGMAFCGTLDNSTLTNVTLLACNYAPGGNIIGEKPY